MTLSPQSREEAPMTIIHQHSGILQGDTLKAANKLRFMLDRQLRELTPGSARRVASEIRNSIIQIVLAERERCAAIAESDSCEDGKRIAGLMRRALS